MKQWQFVGFPGPRGRESRGIVDLLAIRRDHHAPPGIHKPGDLFEIILVQVKGGSARWPTTDDIGRLRAVAKRYRARDTVLASWTKGAAPEFFRLGVDRAGRPPWLPVDPRELFR